jgi:hypothetical protein
MTSWHKGPLAALVLVLALATGAAGQAGPG